MIKKLIAKSLLKEMKASTANAWPQKRIGKYFGIPVMPSLSSNTKLADLVSGYSIFLFISCILKKNSVKMGA